MKIAIPKASVPGERRVALVPDVLVKLKKAGLEAIFEPGAGVEAGFPDDQFTAAGATIAPDVESLYASADIVASLQSPTATEIARLRQGTTLISMLNPLVRHDVVRQLADHGLTSFSLELVPRITRAQSMDVLSSMSSIAGYKAVLIAATALGRIFPLMMTAAGTITPAKVLILGAGVAGLQAIATAKRLGAVVEAFDVRPVVKEQVESLGARFVQVEAPTEDAQDKGGYAKEMSAAYQQKQKEAIHAHAKANDVIITTALIPGKPAPKLLTAEMVRDMKPGSVIVDLAGEAGGNCELSRYNETVVEQGVTILAPANVAATVPYHASQMFARNLTTFLQHLVKDGRLNLDIGDEITRDTLITRGGDVVNARIRQIMGLAPLPAPQAPAIAAGAV